jgi:hypothetical protein
MLRLGVECFHAKDAAIIIMTIFTTLTPLDPDRRPSDAPIRPLYPAAAAAFFFLILRRVRRGALQHS